jgi:hypothetical protein
MLTNNAIAYAHFQLRGGWKNALITAGIYSFVIIAGMTMATKLDPRGIGWIRGWVGGILGIQSLVLLLFATSRISVAIRSDINNKLIESHRLMPLPAWEAIVGYLMGGSSQALALGAASYVIGAVAAATVGISQDQWFAANFILLTFSIFFWTVAAAGAFTMTRGRGGIGWVVGLGFTVFSSQGLIALLLPGLTLLASPIVGRTIWSLKASTGGGLPVAYAFSLPAQIAIGSLCFFAAARKYRQPESPAFTPLMGMALLTAWVIASVAAMQFWDEVCPDIGMFRMGSRDEPGIRMTQVILSTLSAMLLAMLPIANSSRAALERQRRRLLGEERRERFPVSPSMATLLGAILCVSVPMLVGIANEKLPLLSMINKTQPGRHLWACALTGGMILAQLLTMGFILRIIHRGGGRRGVWIILGYMLLFWLGPLGIDLMRAINLGTNDAPVIAHISTFSPVGVLIDAWGQGQVDPTIGVIAQLVVALLFGTIYSITRPRAPITSAESASVAGA